MFNFTIKWNYTINIVLHNENQIITKGFRASIESERREVAGLP